MISYQTDRRDCFINAIGQAPVVMGILNVTPDSFSDGGEHQLVETALARALEMEAEGAAIIDVGGESTRPGAKPVALEDELARVEPVLEAICPQLEIAVSIDTYKAEVARRAADLGAVAINDVGGLQLDPDMATVVAATGSAVIIMHDGSLDKGDSNNVMDNMRRFFERSLRIASNAGIPDGHIILDPGIGFGKTQRQNYYCLAQLHQLKSYGMPILLGLSRKRMIGDVLDASVDERLTGTLSANVVGLMNGARVLRVHDVFEHVQAIRIFNAVKAAP